MEEERRRWRAERALVKRQKVAEEAEEWTAGEGEAEEQREILAERLISRLLGDLQAA